jgi:hypothetical protein
VKETHHHHQQQQNWKVITAVFLEKDVPSADNQCWISVNQGKYIQMVLPSTLNLMN